MREKEDERIPFMHNQSDFINEEEIENLLEENKNPSKSLFLKYQCFLSDPKNKPSYFFFMGGLLPLYI